MILSHIPALIVQADASLRLLRVRWSGGRGPQPYREALAGLVELAREHGTTRLLLELEDFPDIPVFDQLWLSTTLWQRAAHLQVQQVVIILSARRVYNRHVVESLLTQPHTHIRADIQFFAQPDSALDWLTNHSARIPDLLAEWQQTLRPGNNPATLASGARAADRENDVG